jgi:glycosyltransferase involved in cell wall biosynthesis
MTIVEALAVLKNKDWILDVLGDGPMMEKLKERARELAVEKKIVLHGFSNGVAEAISVCDLCLFPSFDEGLGLTLMEAMASGAPVIASDISATRELTTPIGESHSDELLPAGDVSAWADAIGRFLEGTYSPSLSCAIKLPTAEGMATEMLSFYEDISRGLNENAPPDHPLTW